jgi:hypothetical protein
LIAGALYICVVAIVYFHVLFNHKTSGQVGSARGAREVHKRALINSEHVIASGSSMKKSVAPRTSARVVQNKMGREGSSRVRKPNVKLSEP